MAPKKGGGGPDLDAFDRLFEAVDRAAASRGARGPARASRGRGVGACRGPPLGLGRSGSSAGHPQRTLPTAGLPAGVRSRGRGLGGLGVGGFDDDLLDDDMFLDEEFDDDGFNDPFDDEDSFGDSFSDDGFLPGRAMNPHSRSLLPRLWPGAFQIARQLRANRDLRLLSAAGLLDGPTGASGIQDDLLGDLMAISGRDNWASSSASSSHLRSSCSSAAAQQLPPQTASSSGAVAPVGAAPASAAPASAAPANAEAGGEAGGEARTQSAAEDASAAASTPVSPAPSSAAADGVAMTPAAAEEPIASAPTVPTQESPAEVMVICSVGNHSRDPKAKSGGRHSRLQTGTREKGPRIRSRTPARPVEDLEALSRQRPKPVPPLLALQHFMKEKEAEVGNPLMPVELAFDWRDLPQEVQQKYELLAASDEERYWRELDEWNLVLAKLECEAKTRQGRKRSKERISKARIARPPDLPLRPRSSYAIFCAEHAEAAASIQTPEQADTVDSGQADTSVGGRRHVLAERRRTWNALTDDARLAYSAQAKDERARFKRELGEWTRRQDNQDEAQALIAAHLGRRLTSVAASSVVVREPRTRRMGSVRRPRDFPATARSAYKLFCKDFLTSKAAGDQASTQPETVTAVEDEATPPTLPAQRRVVGALLTSLSQASTQPETVTAVEDEATPPTLPAQRRGTGALLASLRQAWRELPPDEQQRYSTLGAEDAARFRRELDDWTGAHPGVDVGPFLAPPAGKLRKRTVLLPTRGPRQQVGKRRPHGFPKNPWSAYKFFCSKFCMDLRAAKGGVSSTLEGEGVTAQDEREQGDGGIANARGNAAVSMLAQMKKAWRSLQSEERQAFFQMSREDFVRFEREFAAWRDSQVDLGTGDTERLVGAKLWEKHSRGFRCPLPGLVSAAPGTMAHVLQSAYDLGLDEERAQGRLRMAQAVENKEQRAGGMAQLDARSIHASEDGRGTYASSRGGEAEVDDLLGDLVLAQDGSQAGDIDNRSDDGTFSRKGLMEDLFEMDARAAAPYIPQPSGQPRVLGPQLCIDESGNLVVNQSSLHKTVDDERRHIDEVGPVQEAVTRYESAYKRTIASKWTREETDRFHQALQLYGTDLFLVQTFFRNKSAAQVKAKYHRELKHNPKLVEELLIDRRQKLTKETFERLHGTIDTSKHYKPPPSPLPGEEREPDDAMPGGLPQEGLFEEEGDFLDAEPEYTEEDSTLTTNRLMALFD